MEGNVGESFEWWSSELKTCTPALMRGKVPVLSLLTLSILLCACGQKEEVAPEAPKPVRTVIAGGAVDSQTATYSGEIRARYESVLAFRIPGKIAERLVEVGSHVKRGQLLLRLDAAQETLQAISSDAEVEASKSRVAKLKLDKDRVEKLLSRKFASQAELDGVTQGLLEAEAGLKAAQAHQQIAVNQRAFSELKADRDGTVTAINSETGQVIGAGQPVVTVAADGVREVPVSVPESRLDELRNAKNLTVNLLALYGCLPDSKQNLRYFVKKSVASLYSALFVDWSGFSDFALAPMHIR
jgi:RND family efflux transporter MFP subunit